MNQIRWGGRWFTGGVLVAVVLMGVAYGQKTDRQAPARPAPSAATAASSSSPDKIVLKVGDTSVTQGEIETFIQGLTPQAQNSLARQGRRPLGDDFVRILTLSQEALNHHLDSTPAFKELLAIRRREILAELAYREIVRQCAVTPVETNKYFAAHKGEFEEVQVLQVVVRKKPEGAKGGVPGFTPEEAKTRAEEIRKAFIAGEDPKKVAEKYQVPNVVRVEAQPYRVQRGSMREDMEKAAFDLKPGQVTEVFDLGLALAFVKVVSHPTPDLKDFSSKIENTLRQQKIDAALATLKKNAKVWMDDAYFTGSSQAGPRGPLKPEGQVTIPVTPK